MEPYVVGVGAELHELGALFDDVVDEGWWVVDAGDAGGEVED